jgi:hypothetical protein
MGNGEGYQYGSHHQAMLHFPGYWWGSGLINRRNVENRINTNLLHILTREFHARQACHFFFNFHSENTTRLW